MLHVISLRVWELWYFSPNWDPCLRNMNWLCSKCKCIPCLLDTIWNTQVCAAIGCSLISVTDLLIFTSVVVTSLACSALNKGLYFMTTGHSLHSMVLRSVLSNVLPMLAMLANILCVYLIWRFELFFRLSVVYFECCYYIYMYGICIVMYTLCPNWIDAKFPITFIVARLTVFDCHFHYSCYCLIDSVLQISTKDTVYFLGIYQISSCSSGWSDIQPFFTVQFMFRIWPKCWMVPDITTGSFTSLQISTWQYASYARQKSGWLHIICKQ